ncbi:hypothetical protein DN757_26730 [Paenibacillus silvae]|uniref:Uncharacterized protein n=1 Tax=Paenibacillus silvae TaxID=1325358 RepID=A0A2W6N9Z0_9BACL|nr:hypothetical protein DN757_26730 [Paenibacillus silvae]
MLVHLEHPPVRHFGFKIATIVVDCTALYSPFTESLLLRNGPCIFTDPQGENKTKIKGIPSGTPFTERNELMAHLLAWIQHHGKLVLLCTCVVLACIGLWVNHKQLFYKE